jgi:4-alpha-glucanotransferase
VSMEEFDRLAAAYGVEPGFLNELGEWVLTPGAVQGKVLGTLGVSCGCDDDVRASLSGAPEPLPGAEGVTIDQGAFWPEWMVEGRAFGFACQLYGLRSDRNWGMGDLEDLAQLAEIAGALGADFIGVNPLHALFTADASRISPYAPSSRLFLNPMIVAPDQVTGWRRIASSFAQDRTALKDARRAELVDYPSVYALKMRAFEALHAHFLGARSEKADARRKGFAAWRKAQGRRLELFTIYETLSEHFVSEGGYVAWPTWPEAYRDPASGAVAAFARDRADRIAFHAWLQWIAERQLAETQGRARAAGMRIGLYLDLAIGVAPDGAMTWAEGGSLAREARVGCPPDMFSAEGQNWGLVPLSPAVMRNGDDAFSRVLEANMRHAGALRLDHVMGIQRLYFIPETESAKNGAYVRYPMKELLERVSEASWRMRCVVIGENLGTVPIGFNEAMIGAGLLGYRILYFTRAEGRMALSSEYPREAMVCASTHDLPTLKGWWIGSDIAWRLKVERITADEAEIFRNDRALDKAYLLTTLADEGLIERDVADRAHEGDMPGEMPDAILAATHAMLARAPSRLFAVQLDDALGVTEQANLPGTVDEHPNWRRKCPVRIEDLAAHDGLRNLAHAIASERPR